MIEPIKFTTGEVHSKKWGQKTTINGKVTIVGETWIVNNDKYCLKFLTFGANKSMSFHYHNEKHETWFVAEGEFIMQFYDLSNGEVMIRNLKVGDVIVIPPGNPHKLTCGDNPGIIVEVSTEHKDEDSYRIGKGDSQK